jgi:hypothetical protein
MPSPSLFSGRTVKKGLLFIFAMIAMLSVGTVLWLTNEHTEEVLNYTSDLKIMIFELQARIAHLEALQNVTDYKISTLDTRNTHLEQEEALDREIIQEEEEILQEVIETQYYK